MTAADPEQTAWLTESRLARAWPTIRATCLHAAADANRVRSNLQVSQTTWGERRRRTYHPADVARVAEAIADGTAELRPHWRNDTPEARQLDRRLRRRNLPGAIGCAVLVVVPLAVVVLLLIVYWPRS